MKYLVAIFALLIFSTVGLADDDENEFKLKYDREDRELKLEIEGIKRVPCSVEIYWFGETKILKVRRAPEDCENSQVAVAAPTPAPLPTPDPNESCAGLQLYRGYCDGDGKLVWFEFWRDPNTTPPVEPPPEPEPPTDDKWQNADNAFDSCRNCHKGEDASKDKFQRDYWNADRSDRLHRQDKHAKAEAGCLACHER